MQATLRVKRFDPESQEGSGFQDFNLEVEDWYTVLDALIKVREEIDGTLSLRCACRASICGSCGMRVNGMARLVCKTRLETVSPNGEPVVIEPMGNMPVMKDLVTDFKPFWDKMRQVTPYLQPEGEAPEGEYLASNESMVHLVGVMNCIMCGACVSDCTALEVDKNFIAPAALAKAYRFVEDPRDGHRQERLGELNEYGGIWDCTRCMYCVEVCPKDVAPMDRIMKMRESAMQSGYTNTSGSRHTKSFANSVYKHGRLDETRLAIESMGYTNLPALLGAAPVGIRAMMRGKFPWRPHKAANRENIKRVFEKVGSDH